MRRALQSINFNNFAFMGIFLNFFAVYLKNAGFNNQQISIITMTGPISHIIVSFSFAYLSDKFSFKEKFLKIITFLSFFLSLFYLVVDSYIYLIILTFIFFSFRNPIIPLTDSATLDYVSNHNTDYGSIRMWGSIGFIFGALSLGLVLDYLSIRFVLYGMSFYLFFCFLSTLKVRVRVSGDSKPHVSQFIIILKDKELIIFLLLCFFHIAGLAGYHIFFGVFLIELGYSKLFVGIASMLAVLSEVVLLKYSKNILSMVNWFMLLNVVFLMTALRWFILGSFNNPVIILLSQLIHSLSFGLFLATSISYIDHKFKAIFRTCGISTFSIIAFGLGSIFGIVVAGQLTEYYGYSVLFYYCGFLSLLTLFISLYFIGLKREHFTVR